MRGWSEDGSDIIVEVAPKRSGGHRYYRVELASSCGETTSANAVRLMSPTGGTAICGNPGDPVHQTRHLGLVLEAADLLRGRLR